MRPSELKQYDADGYVALRGHFPSEEVRAWQRECERLWRTVDVASAGARAQRRSRVEGGTVVDRLDPVIDLSPRFAALARDRRILAPVAAALGSEPLLAKDKLIAKGPGTMGYGLHQDYPYWEQLGFPPGEILSVQVAIDPAHRDNGALEVFRGLHHSRIQAPEDDPRDADERAIDPGLGELIDLAAGDILLFHSLVPHRSGPNTSPASRRALFFTYTTSRHGDSYRRFHSSAP